MTAADATQAFANAAAAIVGRHDVVGTLSGLLADCGGLTGADAIGVMVRDRRGRLELLAATSHTAVELELFQLQNDAGPCLDTFRSGHGLHIVGADEIKQHWGQVGEAIAAAGFAQISTHPLRWQRELIGALNTFHRDSTPLPNDVLRLGQAFADMATAVIVQTGEVTENQLDDRIRQALEGRVVIEQAKGVLAEQRNLDMADAYKLLVSLADPRRDETLTGVAQRIVRAAETGARGVIGQ